MLTIQTILKETFGYTTFRPLQREVIENILARKDTLAVMPTGGGKSLCYQIPALLLPGVTVVVSPLIALMKDQVDQARSVGIPAVVLNSSLTPEEYWNNYQAVQQGQVKLVYASPEALMSERLTRLLGQVQVDVLTIDEAHCISEWGHDFRPEYRQLAAVRAQFPQAVCLALTATATQRVRDDIKTTLRFTSSNEFVASFNRPNLYLQVEPKDDAQEQVLQFLAAHSQQSGIIYCFSRQQVDDLAEGLQRRGFSVRPYHAGLADNVRRVNQDAFVRDDVAIIVATIAFGMGINKPNVRFVIHYDLPKSIENYYQEIGRAGRDGLPAHCLLLYGFGDAAKQRYFINQKKGADRAIALQHLEEMVRYAENTLNCRRVALLNYFGEKDTPKKCSTCDVCSPVPAALENITLPAQKFLSCVVRTGEQYSSAYVAQVLRGEETEDMRARQHHQLSTFAIGKEFSDLEWQRLADDLLDLGYTALAEDGQALRLTGMARTALKNRATIFRAKRSLASAHVPVEKKSTLETPAYNQALYYLLRQKRKQLADEAQVPPYVVFSDRSLIEMATRFPRTEKTFLKIHGVGKVKAEKYGTIFTTLIRDYCRQHPGAAPTAASGIKKKSAGSK